MRRTFALQSYLPRPCRGPIFHARTATAHLNQYKTNITWNDTRQSVVSSSVRVTPMGLARRPPHRRRWCIGHNGHMCAGAAAMGQGDIWIPFRLCIWVVEMNPEKYSYTTKRPWLLRAVLTGIPGHLTQPMSLRGKASAPDIEDWKHWLSSAISEAVVGVKVEAVFNSYLLVHLAHNVTNNCAGHAQVQPGIPIRDLWNPTNSSG